MQRFLISIIIPALCAWVISAYMIFFTLPKNTTWVALFLTTLFVALELSLGTILYIIRTRFAPDWLDKRTLLRESAVLTLPLAVVLVLYLAMRYAAIDTWYSTTLLLLLLGVIEYLIIKRLT